jgi:hypothetical protein
MGLVYRARETTLDRHVAPRSCADKDLFADESERLLAELDRPLARVPYPKLASIRRASRDQR